jgi:hypothetical protein
MVLKIGLINFVTIGLMVGVLYVGLRAVDAMLGRKAPALVGSSGNA